MPASRRKKIPYRLFGEERARLARAVKSRYEAGLSVSQVASEFAIGMELTRSLLSESGADIRQPAGGAALAAPYEHRSPHRDTFVAGIVRNPRGHLLLIKPRNVDQGWRLPPAQNGLPADVLPHYACGRAFLDELNLKVPRRTTHLLAIDYAPKSPAWGTPEAFTLVFEGGHCEGEDSKKLTDTVATRIDLDWVSPTHGDQDVLPGEFARIHAAHHAIQAGREIGTLDQGIPPYPL